MGFAPVDGRQVLADFDGGAITSDAGALLLGATDRAIGLIERFAACFSNGRASVRIVHDVATLVGQLVLGIALDYLSFARTAENAQARLLAALAQTLPITIVGMAAGLLTALALGSLGELRPALARSLLPVALVTQTMPLVALTPLLVLLLGRGQAVTIAITVSVTFFPAFVTIAQGLALIPRPAFDLGRVYVPAGTSSAATWPCRRPPPTSSPPPASPCRGRSWAP